MKSRAMLQERLEKLLHSLPALDVQCQDVDCLKQLQFPRALRPLEPDCEHKAVLRDPNTGGYLCAQCAVAWTKHHSFCKTSIEKAARERRFCMACPCLECTDCDERRPSRLCSYCGAGLCYECMMFIPSTSCACSDCSALLEEAEREREESFEDDD